MSAKVNVCLVANGKQIQTERNKTKNWSHLQVGHRVRSLLSIASQLYKRYKA